MSFQGLTIRLKTSVKIGILIKVCLLGTWALPTKSDEVKPATTNVPNPVPVYTLKITPVSQRNVTTLQFDWGAIKPALAIFKNATEPDKGHWWVVFDKGAKPILPNLTETPIPGIQHIEALSSQDSVILSLVIEPQLRPSVSQNDKGWVLQFSLQSLPLLKKSSVRLPNSTPEELTVSLASPGKEVRFTDPRTGYLHVVIPTLELGFGVDQHKSFPEFHILETVQGVGLQLLKDGLSVQYVADQVRLSHPEGLAISSLHDRDIIRPPMMPMSLFADAQDLDWVSRRNQINERLMDLPHDQHGPGELEIAWLLLGYGQSAEALGYLTHLAQERPSIVDLPVYQMLQGIGCLLLNRLSDAEVSLISCQEEPEVQVWLSLAKVLQYPEHYASNPHLLSQLKTQFLLAKDFVKTYPKPLRIQMTTLILLAGIALNDLETITSFLEQEARPENINAGEVYELARARILMNQNKIDAALQLLGELMEKASSPLVRSIACFDYVKHRLETKVMTEEDAIPQLQSIRTQWHKGWLDRQIGDYLDKRQLDQKATSHKTTTKI